MDLSAELARLGSELQVRTSHRHSTWAGTFRSFPEAFIQPVSIDQLREVVKVAARLRRRICVTGCGHSPSDLTCTSKILINLDRLETPFHLDDDGLVTMSAGIRLRELNKRLAAHGFAMPNIGSIDEQSIAGAIATSTHGSSLFHGILSQNIREIKIMLANGDIRSCSEDENVDLFRAALVSLGVLGIVVEVKFQSVPAFNIEWEQTLLPVEEILSDWDEDLWTAYEYTRWVGHAFSLLSMSLL